MANELEQELLDYAKRRYATERRQLLAVLDLKTKELEEFRQRMREVEERKEELEKMAGDEQARRLEELYAHEQELLNVQKLMERQKNISRREIDSGQAILGKLNERIAQYREEIKQMMEANAKEMETLQKELSVKETEVENLQEQEKDLERKMVMVESASREERLKLEAKILELENFLVQEKEARVKMEAQTKNAVALSTASLLEERSSTTSIREQAAVLSARVKDLEAEKSRMLENWAVERKKWEELWQRERAVWENQKVEAVSSSFRTLKERQQWETMLRAKEEKEIRLMRVFSSFLSEINRWRGQFSSPPSSPPQAPSPEREEFRQAMESVETEKSFWKRNKKRLFFASFASFASVTSFAYYYFLYVRPIAMVQASYWDLAAGAPSGIALDPGQKGVLWLADWKTGEFLQADRSDLSRILARVKPALTFFHPNSIAFSSDGKYFFSLDSVSHKIYKHQAADPAKILEETETPSAASLFLALVDLPPAPVAEGKEAAGGKGGEGQKNEEALMVLDTVEKRIYRYHPASLRAKPELALKLSKNSGPLALSGGKSLWVLDAKTGTILRFKPMPGGGWKKMKPVRPLLDSAMPSISAASGFLVIEEDSLPRELFALFEGEPGKIVQLK